MDYEKHGEEFDHLRHQVLWLLIAYFIFKRRVSTFSDEVSNMTRIEWIEETVMLETLMRDIVLRVVKLDDKQSGMWSFRDAKKLLNREIKDPDRRSEVNEAVKAYRSLLQNLKNDHRNKYIAHLQKGELSQYRFPEFPSDLQEAVEKAVQTLDVLVGDRVGYQFSPGSKERNIDLRDALL